MSVSFPHAILGPEMAAPIFMGTWILVWLFLHENLHAHKLPGFRGGILGWGGKANFIFMGEGIFSSNTTSRDDKTAYC